jgi:hypothetical protein
MAGKGRSIGALSENPLVTELIAQGAETSIMLRGFIGPSARDGYVRLYPKLQNLSDSVEIARSDVLHSVQAPQSALGAVGEEGRQVISQQSGRSRGHAGQSRKLAQAGRGRSREHG